MKNYRYYRIIFILILAVTLTSAYFISVYAAAAYLRIEQSGIYSAVTPDFAAINRGVSLSSDDTVAFSSINPSATGERQAAEIWKIIRKYSATGKFIIEQTAAVHGADAVGTINKWLAGAGQDSLFMNLSFAEHEEYHFFQYSVSPECVDISVWNAGRQMIGDKVVCVPFNNYLPVTTVFKTVGVNGTASPAYGVENVFSRMNGKSPGLSARDASRAPGNESIIVTGTAAKATPAELRTFRWEMYVSPDSILDSNTKGAYGLLNELGAYYYGYKTAADCQGYLIDYLNVNGYSQDLVFGYLASVSDALSFYEFKFWTLEYLIYLKEHFPEHYRDFLANGPYLEAFVYFHDCFEELVERIIPEKNKVLLDMVNGLGIKGWEDDEAVWIGKNGIGKQTETVRLLKNQMALPEYITMMNNLRNAIIYDQEGSYANHALAR